MIENMKSHNTLKIYERLKKGKTSDAQARELAEILYELVDNQIATKNDLKHTGAKLSCRLKSRNPKQK